MPRRDDYDYEDDEYDDRPRARRDDRRYDEDEEDDGYDDYDRRPRRSKGRRRDEAAEKVTIPAIFMMILGAIGLLLAIANAAYVFSGAADDEPNAFGGPQDPNMKNDPAYIAGQVIATVVTIGWGLLVFLGGLQMKKLSSRGFVMFSSILVMLPCNWCCVIGIPLGIWALVVMNDDDVKRSFS